jgi:hypothetical protein
MSAPETEAKTFGGHGCVGEPSVLQYSGLLGPAAALIAFGLKTVTNATKHKAPIPNVKTLKTSFI